MHEIRNYKIHKGYIWLLSIYKGAAYYSVHKWQGSDFVPVAALAAIFQSEHDRQINSLIKEQLINNSGLRVAN